MLMVIHLASQSTGTVGFTVKLAVVESYAV